MTFIPPERKFYAASKTPDIIAMLEAGKKYKEIAETLNVKAAYVCAVKTRYISGPMRFTIEGLLPKHMVAINKMAKDIGVTTPELARSILIDAIEDEMDKNALSTQK